MPKRCFGHCGVDDQVVTARGLVLTVVRPGGPSSTSAPLALMHRLHSGDGDPASFFDQVVAYLLLRQGTEPRAVPCDQMRHGAHGEVPC